MKKYDVIIIGGGAGGMFLASELAGKRVALVEANDRVGKKLLATGNGKCNLSNLDMNIIHYNHPAFVEGYLDRFGAHDTIATFERMGLITKVVDKRVYPYSECATTVLDVLRSAMDKAGTDILTGHIVNSVEYFADTYTVGGICKVDGQTKSFSLKADNVVLATGSPATFGRNSNNLFTALGHTHREYTPSLVPVKTNKEPIKGLAGVRVKAGVRCGARYEVGEVLFKDFGVSGIAVFNMSSEIARGKLKIGSNLIIDFMPEYSQGEVETLLRKRGNVKVGELLSGTFHSRVVDRIIWASGASADDMAQPKITTIAKAIKSYPVKVEGLGDVSLSQVMSGGLNIREFDSNLMSMKSKNAYAIGEAIDVDGDCGGYNLQWTWTSAKIVADAIRKQY